MSVNRNPDSPLANLLIEMIEGVFDQYLKPGEQKLLRMRYGFDQMGEQSHARIAQLMRIEVKKVQIAEIKALLKIPLSSLQMLQRYLTDDDHPYHQNISQARRQLLLKMVKLGILYHLRMSNQQVKPTTKGEIAQVSSSPSEAPTTPAVPKIFRSRNALLVAALQSIGRPAHYTAIHARALTLDSVKFAETDAKKIMLGDRDFVKLSDSVFALAAWKNQTVREGEAVLLSCPNVVEHFKKISFFEAVIQVRAWLTAQPLTAQLLSQRMGREFTPAAMTQGMFDLLYALGVCAPTELVRGAFRPVALTLPASLDVIEARRCCLDTLCRRLDRMPELLGALNLLNRPNAVQLSEAIYGNVYDGFDLPDRLKLLEAFDTVRKVDKQGWQLTELGYALADTHSAHVGINLLDSDDGGTDPLDLLEDIGWLEEF